MVLNPDCVRAVLLAVEACPFGEHLNVEKLSARLPKYTEECLWYTCLKLKEGGYLDLDLIQMSMSTMPDIKRIKDLTFSGHEFLANIQKDDVWQGVKEIGIANSFLIPFLISKKRNISNRTHCVIFVK